MTGGEETKKRILDTALSLFYEKGYEMTSIQDILYELSISKGAFYYHFHSKEDLLDTIVWGQVEKIVERLSPILQDTSISATDKLFRVIEISWGVKIETMKKRIMMYRVLQDINNLLYAFKLKEKINMHIIPIIEKIIEEGVNENHFNTSYPDEMARLYIECGNMLNRDIISVITDKNISGEEKKRIIKRKVIFFGRMIDKMLGMKHAEDVLLTLIYSPLEKWINEKEEYIWHS